MIDERPLYERYTDEVMRLKASGKTWDEIVARVPISEPTAVQAWRFAPYGTPSGKLPPGRKKRKWRAGEEPKYVSHAAEVGRLKDVEGLSFEKIGSRLGIHRNTAMFAYQQYLAVGQARIFTNPDN